MATESCPGPVNTTIKFLEGTINLSKNQWNHPIDFNWYNSQMQSILRSYQCYNDYFAQLLLEGELLKN